MVKQLLVLFLLCGTMSAQQATTLTLEGSITAQDAKQYRLLPFAVPAGTRRLTVEMTHTGRQEGTLTGLAIEDPATYRGAGRALFTISEADATPPFLPGPLPAGEWKLWLGVAQVGAGRSDRYTIRITLDSRVDGESSAWKTPVPRREAGWYAGDLHSHTGHSDGVCRSQKERAVPCPAHRLVEAAAQQKLDFLAVTDHNTTSTLHFLREMQPFFDGLLLIHGREMTTFNGHANVWGTSEFLDPRIGFAGWTVNRFLDQVHEKKALASINHPHWPTDERCPGCGWGWKQDTDFAKVDAIEVVNGYKEEGSYFKPPPGNGVPFWEEQIAKGYRITAVGGGDDHRSGEQLYRESGVGRPTTVVYARELSERAILEGIQAGHVYIRATGPQGPELYLTQGERMMGDAVEATAGQALRFRLQARKAQGATLRLLLDGKPVEPRCVWSGLAEQAEYSCELVMGAQRHWVRAELLTQQGELLAMTNPIYVNFRKRP